MFLL
ncbi:unnamed protein product [Acanthoscelides obtectus]|jgi:hypothetical protein